MGLLQSAVLSPRMLQPGSFTPFILPNSTPWLVAIWISGPPSAHSPLSTTRVRALTLTDMQAAEPTLAVLRAPWRNGRCQMSPSCLRSV